MSETYNKAACSVDEQGLKFSPCDAFIMGFDKPLDLDCSSLVGDEVRLVTTSEMEGLMPEREEEVLLQDLDITMPMRQDCPEIPRPPRTSTPIPEDRAEPNFPISSVIREHSYHVSSHSVTGVVRNRECPLSNFMKHSWSETRVSKNPLKKTCLKSKKIEKKKRKFFTKEQISIATNRAREYTECSKTKSCWTCRV